MFFFFVATGHYLERFAVFLSSRSTNLRVNWRELIWALRHCQRSSGWNGDSVLRQDFISARISWCAICTQLGLRGATLFTAPRAHAFTGVQKGVSQLLLQYQWSRA